MEDIDQVMNSVTSAGIEMLKLTEVRKEIPYFKKNKNVQKRPGTKFPPNLGQPHAVFPLKAP